MRQSIYVAVDGDNVGASLERLMIVNDVKMLREFSRDYEPRMRNLIQIFVQRFDADIIFYGGDNFLASFEQESSLQGQIQEICNDFKVASGQTVSAGLGESPREAYIALRLAKTKPGKGTVQDFNALNK